MAALAAPFLSLAPGAAAFQTPSPGVEVIDLDLAVAGSLAFADDVLLFAVSEFGQGGDLNGDGDIADTPLRVLRPSSGELLDLDVSGLPIGVLEARALYRAREFDDGVDRNGDGDLFDTVFEAYDAVDGTFLRPGWAGFDVVAAADLAAVHARELDQGATDLNGDGDVTDTVIVVVDLSTGVATNLGLAELGVAVERQGVAFLVPEASQGNADLNGDGDTGDRVLHLWDRSGGTVVSTGLAAELGTLVALEDGLFACGVSEAGQGHTDLNGDGDAQDTVLHLFTLDGAPPSNLGLATGTAFAGRAVGSRSLIAFAVEEAGQGATDLNGDGDDFDRVAHLVDRASGQVTNLRLAVPAFDELALDGARLVLRVSEPDQGLTDLDGDGFVFGDVAHTYDHVTGALVNLALPAAGVALGGALAVFEVPEASSDLNGDGDLDDVVAAIHDLATGATQTVPLVCFEPFVDGALVHWTVPEFGQGGVDVNGDGDAQDGAIVTWDATFGRVLSDGLLQLVDRPTSFLNRVATAVDEAADGGTDLNGDGDANDRVLTLATLPVLNGLTSDRDRISLADGGEQRFELAVGANLGHRPYVLLGGLSGTLPGVLLGSRFLPLNPDVYTRLALVDPDAPPFTAFVGLLDRAGRTAMPRFVLPAGADPVLAGLVAHHAAAVFDLSAGLAVAHTTNAVRLELVP